MFLTFAEMASSSFSSVSVTDPGVDPDDPADDVVTCLYVSEYSLFPFVSETVSI